MENQTLQQKERKKKWWKLLLIKHFKEILPWFFTLLVILSFGYFLDKFMTRQNQAILILQQKSVETANQRSVLIDEAGNIKQKINIDNNSTAQDKSCTSKESEQKINIPLEVLKEVKGFNETLNQRQNETLQLILYVVAFIGIIATFFGYKTIKDIKDSAKDAANDLNFQYSMAFDLLNKQISQWHDFNQRYLDETKRTIETLTSETKRAQQNISEAESKIDQTVNEDAEKKKEFAEKVENDLDESKKDFQ